MSLRAEEITVRGWHVACDAQGCETDLTASTGVTCTTTYADAERLWEDAEGLLLSDGTAYCSRHASAVSMDRIVADQVTVGEAGNRARGDFPGGVTRRPIRAPKAVA